MEKNVVIKTVSTKAYEGADAVETELTVDFTSLTLEDIREIAAQSAVIKWQSNVRRAKGAIPKVATYIVPKPGTRSTADPIEVLLRRTGGNVDDAIALLRARMENRA